MTISGIVNKDLLHNGVKFDNKTRQNEDFQLLASRFQNLQKLHMIEKGSSNIQALQPTHSLIAINETLTKSENIKYTLERTRGILNKLKGILASILSGKVSTLQVEELKTLVNKYDLEWDDSEYGQICAEIYLRAEVEIAKIENASADS